METYKAHKQSTILNYIIPIIALGVLASTGYLAYSKFKSLNSIVTERQTVAEDVLGEKAIAVEQTVCNSNDYLSQQLNVKNVVVPLYTPDKHIDFNVSGVSKCISFPTCNSDSISCTAVLPEVDQECLTQYLENNPLDITEESEIINGETAFVVRKQDWVLSREIFVAQLKKKLEEELSYCSLSGSMDVGSSKLNPIVIPVTDILPGLSNVSTDQKVLEIDNTKEKAYYWHDGTYQEIRMIKGADAGNDRLIRYKNFSISNYFSSREAEYLNGKLEGSDWVVIHD